MGYGGKPPPGARRVRFLSLHDDDETIVFTFSALLLFGGRLYSPRVFSRYYYSHPNKQQRSPSSPSPSSSSSPFVRSERAREEKRHKTTTHKHRRKKSLRAFSVQITRIENAFYFCFLLFRVFVSEKSLNPKPTRIFFPHRGEKCKILLSVCIFIFRTRKHTRTIIHNKYDFCSHFHNRSRRCRVFCV